MLPLTSTAWAAPDAVAGKEKAKVCAACHGAEGKGNPQLGAPNLTDNIWLYGSSEATIIEGITKGRHVDPATGLNAMPSFESQLTPVQIRVAAAYVWGLSNKAPAAK